MNYALDISESTHRKGKIALLGAGAVAAAGLGTYLYNKPKLRRNLRKAHSVKEAASMVGTELRQDSAEMANTMMSTVAEGTASRLQKVRSMLGSRFSSTKNVAKQEAKRMKREVKRAKKVAHAEAKHLKNEMKESRARVEAAATPATA